MYFTSRMAGVIFKAWKQGKINMSEENVKCMYDLARAYDDSMYKSRFYNQNWDRIDCLNSAVKAIFENDYKEANYYIEKAIERNFI